MDESEMIVEKNGEENERNKQGKNIEVQEKIEIEKGKMDLEE